MARSSFLLPLLLTFATTTTTCCYAFQSKNPDNNRINIPVSHHHNRPGWTVATTAATSRRQQQNNHRNDRTTHDAGRRRRSATPSALFLSSSSSSSAAQNQQQPVDDAAEQQRQVLRVRVVDRMPEPLPPELKNDYYLLRHGQSTANVDSVISSSRSLAYSEKHGLTALGYEQGVQSAQQLLRALSSTNNKNKNKNKKLIFVSSPFARAIGTARACLDGLTKNNSELLEGTKIDLSTDIVVRERLMERYFGRLDDEAIYTYAYVWPLDKFNVTHTAFGVESVAAVCTRLRELIVDDLEARYEGCSIVLVSHADVLQICQLYAIADCRNVGLFSSYRFGNGEVRYMDRNEASLPEPVPLKPPDRRTRTE